MRVLVLDLKSKRPLWRMPDWVLDHVAAAVDDVWEIRVVDAVTDSDGDGGDASPEAVRAARGAEVYMGYGLPRSVWDALEPTVRWIHSAAAGVASALRQIGGHPVPFTNSAGIHAEPMADWVLGAILHFTRGFDLAVRGQHSATWDKRVFTGGKRRFAELADLSVGILGLGGTGRAVARRCALLGMMVRGVSRRGGMVPYVEDLVPLDHLAKMAQDSDVLVVGVPLTEGTRCLVDAPVLAAMPDGGIVINVSRGEVVDEAALIAETATGRLRAALDVFETEPLPEEHAFWTSSHVLVNPHVSPVTDRFWEREAALMVDNLVRYQAGETLVNLVDAEAGY